MIPPRIIIALLAALVTTFLAGGASGSPPTASAGVEADEVTVQLRIWQQTSDPEALWISAREMGTRWDTLGTIPLPLDARGGAGFSDALSGIESSHYYYSTVEVAGIGLRIWQRRVNTDSIYVEACSEPCVYPIKRFTAWRPLGKIPVALDDGISATGSYRYGNLEIAVPRDNPGLQADREHLLALRDVLEGGGPALNWHAERATTDWEGITVDGTPSRVVGINLSGRGLTGELWGWIGDLTELTELRLDHNRLRGLVPSKIALLERLSVLALEGNEFAGCLPFTLPALLGADFNVTDLPRCEDPQRFRQQLPNDNRLGTGTHVIRDFGGHRYAFDVPQGHSAIERNYESIGMDREYITIDTVFQAVDRGHAIHDATNDDVWLYLWTAGTVEEILRSHYTGCIYDCTTSKSPSALIEQLAASFWRMKS